MSKYLYDENWQKKVVKYLIESNAFDYVQKLNEDLFDTFELKQIFRFLKQKSRELWRVPSYDVILHECGGFFQKKDVIPESKQKIILVVDELRKLEIVPEEIRMMVKDFIVNQELRDLGMKLNQNILLGQHDIRLYQREINRIAAIEIDYKPGIFVSKFEVEKISAPERIPIHLSTLNEWMKGGIERGELGFVFGQSGIGKSFMLVNIAVSAHKIGKTVFYYTFELSEYHTYLRIVERITGVSSDWIKERPIKFRKKMDARMKHAEIYIKEFPSEGATVNDIKADIDMIKSEYGLVPDVLVVDYCDIIKPLHFTDDWRQIGDNAVQLRRLAKEINAAVWTASQIKVEYWDKEYSGKASGRSIRKVDMADIVFGLMWLDPEDESRLLIKALKLRRAKAPNKKMLVKIDRDKSIMTDLGEYKSIRKGGKE